MFATHNNIKYMKFVDRTSETMRLKTALARKTPSFIVLYGRRRLGKSTLLIKRVLTDNDVYFLADKSEQHHQRSLLAKIIAHRFADFDKATYPDWESILRALNHRTTERFTLCLDEFPYLVEQSHELPSILQKLIDEKQLRYNIIVCGSSQNMMYDLFFDATAPLYGRADEIIRLTPLRLRYIQEALNLSPINAIEEYAVWGGVPRYWELRENNDSLTEALWHHVFTANGILYDEPSKLFQDDIKDTVKVSTIMSYIGSGAKRLSEIASRCNEPATNLSRPLSKLIDLGFLIREVPFGLEEKNAKKSFYKIADPFMAFYYQEVVPNRSFIELERRKPIEDSLLTHFSEFVSLQWEQLCRNAITGNEVDGILYGKARRWWGTLTNSDNKPEQIELDLVAESINKKYLLVGECKWTRQEKASQLFARLLRKASMLPFKQNHTIVPLLFLKNPPKDKATHILLPENIISEDFSTLADE